MKRRFNCKDCDRLKCPYYNYKRKKWNTIEYFCSCCHQKLGEEHK